GLFPPDQFGISPQARRRLSPSRRFGGPPPVGARLKTAVGRTQPFLEGVVGVAPAASMNSPRRKSSAIIRVFVVVSRGRCEGRRSQDGGSRPGHERPRARTA